MWPFKKKMNKTSEVSASGPRFSEGQKFQFVQMDASLHDTKFHDKPTTFFKDAMKRFRKNHSSVIAGVLLGILIGMALIVPVADTNDIDTAAVYAYMLPPKWHGFEGTGFLDGTKNYNDVVGYDSSNSDGSITKDTTEDVIYPSGFKKDSVVDKTLVRYKTTANNYSVYGYGGSLQFSCKSHTENGVLYSPTAFFRIDRSYSLDVTFDNDLSSKAESLDPTYSIYAMVAFDSVNYTKVLLQASSKNYNALTISDLTAMIKAANPDPNSTLTQFKTYFCLELETNTVFAPEESGLYPTLYIDSFAIKCTSTTDVNWNAISWADGNTVKLRDVSENADVSKYKWSISGAGQKNAWNVNIWRCNFRYDCYKAALGDTAMVVDYDAVKQYIANQWMSYDFAAVDSGSKTATEAFTLLNDACPLRSVDSQKKNIIIIYNHDGSTSEEITYDLTGIVSVYRYHGMSAMPYYVFGTDFIGRDYFKYVFRGLRTSLALGLLCATINISFGLLWGSTSGYFGGWTDILMERFTEILGGVPWIVVMTLILLKWGSNFWTFLLALCLTGWIGVAGVTRSQFYRFKGREYVLASRTLGASDARLIFKHILPNGIGTIITGSVLMIPAVIFDEAVVAYLGLGLTDLTSFGVALSDAQNYLGTYPHLIISGSLIICILMISFNLFGNGLRDAFNPSLKGVDE
jgi:oligopeptide transport system permease protein